MEGYDGVCQFRPLYLRLSGNPVRFTEEDGKLRKNKDTD